MVKTPVYRFDLYGRYRTLWPNAGECVLVCDNHHLAKIRRLYELGWSYPYERPHSAIEFAVFEYVELPVQSYAPIRSIAKRSIDLTSDFPLEDA